MDKLALGFFALLIGFILGSVFADAQTVRECRKQKATIVFYKLISCEVVK